MTREYRYYQIDSFTKDKFAGNPAGVIVNADGLSEAEMQHIAREVNNSETAFILASDSPDYDVHVRFFTPTVEVPICGHATIAAHYARATELQLESTRVLHKTGAGILPVDIVRENNDYKIVMKQGTIDLGPVIKGENKTKLLEALKLSREDLIADVPIQIVSTGHSKVMIPLKNKEKMNRIAPNYEALSQLSKSINCNGYYVFTLAAGNDDVLVEGRMFAPAIGIHEDPVTGNANGPLGPYLILHQLVKPSGTSFRFRSKQGEAMGRPGTVEVEVLLNDGKPASVHVAGQAIIVYQAKFVLD
ncbi:PhzF family isomerase [Paenibacillus sp. P96]|uniref:PhzF family isomerase n=1 Tax=Paenibacillus zeirhizosphaerae TaxID=2987519 RepID=A0ABT9FVT3_9BACL|nr:PhzF family isomerase [Paenibacillus sp. P96]MDP4098805.1 PhzF family isomerase [Paenibacillus sp. P96]